MRICVAGGGSVGRYIAEDLTKAGHYVTIIERDQGVIERSQKVDNLGWFHSDACELSHLTELGLETYDVFVAATGDDEDNLVASLIARQEFAVPRILARVNHPKNAWLFNETWGVDQAVSVPHLMTGMIEEAVGSGQLVRLMQLVGGKAGLVEVTLASDSPAIGKQIENLEMPRSSNLVAILRDGALVIPSRDTVFHIGDEVIALVTPESEEPFRKVLIAD